jgi:hypothetical protein
MTYFQSFVLYKQEDGTSDEEIFQNNMKKYGPVLKKVSSPLISVTSRHIHQLMKLKKKLPQDKSFAHTFS